MYMYIRSKWFLFSAHAICRPRPSSPSPSPLHGGTRVNRTKYCWKKIAKYTGFGVYRRSYLVWPPVSKAVVAQMQTLILPHPFDLIRRRAATTAIFTVPCVANLGGVLERLGQQSIAREDGDVLPILHVARRHAPAPTPATKKQNKTDTRNNNRVE